MSPVTVEDRFAIQDVAYAYAFYCDTQQYTRCPELFADDAVFDETCLGLPLANGIAEIRAQFGNTDPRSIAYFIHYVTSVWVRSASDNRASVVCYLRGEGCFTNGANPSIRGYYDDVMEKVDGRWLIKSRKLVPFAPPSGWTFPYDTRS